jgi:hypothetical protein
MDSSNCSSQNQSLTITEPSALNLTLSSTPEIDGLDGTATAIVTGGTAPYSYSWDDNNSQPESMAVYLESNWYNVVVTDANGCVVSDSVFVDTESGIKEIDKNDFVIYPNPTKETIQIIGTGKLIRIRDFNGKLIDEISYQKMLNIGFLSNGIYTLEILSENNQINRIRFTKID